MTRILNKNIDTNSTTLFAITALVILSITMPVDIFATHYVSSQKWSVTNVDVCYSTSLNNLVINGQINQFAVAASQIDGARNDWNDEPSVWTFNNLSSCTHWFSVTSLGTSGPVGRTYLFPPSSTPLTDADTSLNKDYAFSSTNTCSLPPYYLQYIATHELGHWLKLDHSPDPPAQSVMYEFANCAGTTVRAHDSSSMTSMYG